MSSHLIVVALSSSKPFFVHGLKMAVPFSGDVGAEDPRNPIRATRDYQGRQSTRALDDHGVSVELAALSAGQRPECMVSRALRPWGQALATDGDCRRGPQVTHCAMAFSRDRRVTGRSGPQSGISA